MSFLKKIYLYFLCGKKIKVMNTSEANITSFLEHSIKKFGILSVILKEQKKKVSKIKN